MAKKSPDPTLDTLLDYVDQSNVMVLCSAEPGDYAAVAGVTLASVAMAPDTDYTKADAPGGGRRLTTAIKPLVPVSATGLVTHVALIRTTDSTLRYVTTCASLPVTAGNYVDVPAWSITIGDPV